MNKNYKSIIFTDHALERLEKRSITPEMVYQVVSSPFKKHPGKNTTKFIKNLNDRNVHVVAQHLNKEKKWLIISVWVRGEDDLQPLAWRILTFPFWIIWIFLKWLFKKVF